MHSNQAAGQSDEKGIAMANQRIQWNPWTCILILAAGLALLMGCGGAPLQVTPIDPNANPAELIGRLKQDLAAAKAEEQDVLSPTWFRQAEASHRAAQKELDRGGAPADIRERIARAQAELQQAGVVAIRCHDQLDETIQSRKVARTAQAQQFTEDYATAENNFLKLTQAMEAGDFQYAREKRGAVAEQFRALELRAIAKAELGDIRRLLAEAEQTRVPQDAPKSYAQAKEALAQAEAYVGANRYDQKTIQQKADDARRMAQRAIVMAQASRKIEKMRPEDVALWIESFLAQTSTQLKSADRRNLSFDQQQEAILAAVMALQSEYKGGVEKEVTIQKLMERLAEMEGTSQSMRFDQERMAADQRFNAIFTQVQDYFSPDEAEVYKQADRLIIRLKGMRFPVGQAEITPDNHALLAKVQKAIRTFGNPDVIIEGHTDTTGSVQKNEAISKRRADAVRHYLVDGYTVSTDRITATGFGSARPVASNETAEGRAQNRRIDVIIQPRVKAMK
jgi:OmpA-OmpF porin, OOP family